MSGREHVAPGSDADGERAITDDDSATSPIYILPDSLLTLLASYLPPSDAARCMSVSRRWYAAAGHDAVWRRWVRDTIARCHREPHALMQHPPASFFAGLGLSRPPSRVAQLEAAVAEAAAAAADACLYVFNAGSALAATAEARMLAAEARHASALAALSRARAHEVEVLAASTAARDRVIAEARRAAAAAHTLRAAYVTMPQLRWSSDGVYILTHEYVRKGVRDMWHALPSDGSLACTYHRIVALRPDGTLAYVMLAGTRAEALRELRRAIASWDGVAVAAPPAPHRLTLGSRTGESRNGANSSSPVGFGWWRLTGSSLEMEVHGVVAGSGGSGHGGPRALSGRATLWRCQVEGGAYPHRAGGTLLSVLSMGLLEDASTVLSGTTWRRGGSTGDALEYRQRNDALGAYTTMSPLPIVPILRESDCAEFVWVPSLGGVQWRLGGLEVDSQAQTPV